MTCEWRPLPGGGMVVTCSRGRRKTCSAPGCTSPAGKQCDYPVVRKAKSQPPEDQPSLPAVRTRTIEGTCDAWICDRHAKRVGPDRDCCPPHARLSEEPR